ncbi:MAG TPA: NADH-quinone oxidoreductase subunit J [bacterium]|jgi:NADH-quinone oxidoreductase subunit J|nr:NADH-quinone oxidoreductase subunit J [bacterium]
MMLEAFVFYILAAALVLFGLLMITRTNPISAAMTMVGAFGVLAGLYATLSASFVSIIQILVYAGGIMVLVIFVIMLLNMHPDDLKPMKAQPFWVVLALLAVSTTILAPILCCVLPNKDFTWAALTPDFGTLTAVGEKIFSDFIFPFEVLSLILLTAVIGALVMAKRKL